MKIAVEFRSFMSIAETFRALTICQEATERLAHRMSESDLDRIDRFALALAEIAGSERARRAAATPRFAAPAGRMIEAEVFQARNVTVRHAKTP